MIIPDFLIHTPSGLFCRAGSFYLDPVLAVQTAVVSHAHGDHAVAGNQQVYCTAPTASFMQSRLKEKAAGRFTVFPFGQSFSINGVGIRFLPAGHILGSAMVMMKYRDVRYLYTGDFKLQADATCETLLAEPADVLITESTFADPAVAHPDPVAEINKLNGHNHNILLGVYGLGKAQRLTHLISTHCPSRTILLHYSILPLHSIYKSYGFNAGSYQAYERKLMKPVQANLVYMVPPLTFGAYTRAKNVMRVFASGWKHRQKHNDMELLISDHADWNDLLALTARVKPAELWTVHGDGAWLKKHFEGRMPVKHLN